MKKFQAHQLLLLITSICCIHVNAQSRLKKNYIDNDGVQTLQVKNKAAQTLLPTSLSGYYFEGFENTFPPAGWQVVDVLDTAFEWSNQVMADYPAVYEGSNSAYMHYNFDGAPGGEDWLIMPKFTVTAGDSLSFQFKFEYMGYPPDSTFILISTTDSTLTSFTIPVDFIADTVTAPGTVLPLWTYYSYTLNAYAGQDIYVAFKNKNIFGDGVFIDNIELGTRPTAEVSVLSIDMEQYYASGSSTPVATVKNRGSVAQTFDVTLSITGGYTSTKPVTLGSQAAVSVLFDPWNATVGNYTISVQTLLTGDVNPANDTISKTIKVLEPFVNYGWSTHDPLVEGNVGAAVASVCTNSNSRYFLMGGYTSAETSDAYEYDLIFATWAGINSMPSVATYSASAKANGQLFVFGGRNATSIIATTQIYDFTLATWTTGTAIPIPVSSPAFGTYKDSLVYIIGGNIAGSTGSNTVQIYNVYTNSWTSGTAKPGDPVYGCRGGIVNNKIVVSGGFSSTLGVRIGTTYVGVIDAVNPSQITWTQVDDHPTGIISKAGSAASLDTNSGLVVFAGGTITNSTDVTSKTFAYDVNSNSWKLGPDKPTALELFYMTPVLQNDSLYLAALGGGDGFNVYDKNEWLNLGYYQLPTGIAENNFVADANLYPNPANEATTLSLNLKNAAHVEIYITDVLGNVVLNVGDKNFDAGKNTISFQTKSLTSGIYFCVINFDDTTITKKLLKN